MHTPWTFELLKVELEAECFYRLFESFFLQGGTLEILIEGIEGQIIPDYLKKIEAFFSLPVFQKEKYYLNLKRSIFEMRKWFELHVKFYKLIHKIEELDQLSIDKVLNTLGLFDDLIEKLSPIQEDVLPIRSSRLSVNFKASIEKIKKQLHHNIFHIFEEERQVKLIHFQLASLVYQKISNELEQMVSYIANHRNQWDEAALESARTLYIPKSQNLPFPLIYTPQGHIYMIQEVLEHFVGYGACKYVTRTFEILQGHIYALIRPKKKDRYVENPRLEKAMQIRNYQDVWREATFLKKLKGKEGIVQIEELCIFPFGETLEFFEVCELFENQGLDNLLGKKNSIRESDKISIAHDLLKGLHAISQQGIIHRDIKAGNVLFEPSTSYRDASAKIIDFSFACHESEQAEKARARFNSIYCAPEYVQALFQSNFQDSEELIEATTLKLDVWNVGCLLYQLLFQQDLPWKTEELNTPIQKSTDTNSEKQKQLELKTREEEMITNFNVILHLTDGWIPPHLHRHPFYPLMSGMLTIDPKKRIDAAEALSLFEATQRQQEQAF